MQLQVKTLLNRVYPHKGFVYSDVRLCETEQGATIVATVERRANSKSVCPHCRVSHSRYDRRPERRYSFVPLWAMAVVLVYRPWRVECPVKGPVVEYVPWAHGKSPMTKALMVFLATWARRLSWEECAKVFGFNWYQVRESVRWVVQWGLEHRYLKGIEAIGIDEVAYRKGHKYLTVVYELGQGTKRLLWLGENRTSETITRFFTWFGPQRCSRLRFVCSDMWRAYLSAVQRFIPHVCHVLDRFHIAKALNEAVDETRRKEAADLRREGDMITLKKTRWCLLKRVQNLTNNQAARLADLLKINLRTVRAYIMKEDFDMLWLYESPVWAGKFLDTWCTRAMRSRIDPMKKVARTLRAHRPLILNYFRAKKQLSSGTVEGLNNKLKLITRKSYGFRSLDTIEIALFHTLGDLPIPPSPHSFV